MAESKMIVGLGNPGRKYEGTRHNIGFRVIDLLVSQLGIKVNKKKFGGFFGRGEFEDKKLILLKPQRYMNRSGGVVSEALGFYKLALSDLLVITDDMALEPGRMRVRARGSAGGHNGLVDIIEKLGTEEFNRLRIGIGQSGADGPWRDYVLDEPRPEELELIETTMQKAQQAVLCWIRFGVEAAMNEFNG